jgi:competence protein ComEA
MPLAPPGTVNINTADAATLQRLPGIGEGLARRIIAYRQEVGGFKSPEQMLDVRGIGEEEFAALQGLIRVR